MPKPRDRTTNRASCEDGAAQPAADIGNPPHPLRVIRTFVRLSRADAPPARPPADSVREKRAR